MSKNLKAFLGIAAILVPLAGTAVAQESQTVWKTDGKHYWRTEEVVRPAEMPKTQRIEVATEERQAGDVQGFKYVGKRLEPAYFREVPIAVEAHKGHECSWRMVHEGRRLIKYDFCIVNGVEEPCAGMNADGVCLNKH